MSELLIKGIKMPNKRHFLQILIAENGDLSYEDACYNFPRTGFILHESKAIEVPPHGRLGDLDALAEHIKDVYCKDCKRSKVMCKACEYGDILDEIEDAPTIIEASN